MRWTPCAVLVAVLAGCGGSGGGGAGRPAGAAPAERPATAARAPAPDTSDDAPDRQPAVEQQASAPAPTPAPPPALLPPGAPSWWFDGVQNERGRLRVAASADAGSLTEARTGALAAARARLRTAVSGTPTAEEAEMIHAVTLGVDRFRCFVRMSCASP